MAESWIKLGPVGACIVHVPIIAKVFIPPHNWASSCLNLLCNIDAPLWSLKLSLQHIHHQGKHLEWIESLMPPLPFLALVWHLLFYLPWYTSINLTSQMQLARISIHVFEFKLFFLRTWAFSFKYFIGTISLILFWSWSVVLLDLSHSFNLITKW